jgi:hypothetical protein
MQLTATDPAYIRDCARRYAPRDTDLFEADVLDSVRVGLLLGDAIRLPRPRAIADLPLPNCWTNSTLSDAS